MPKRDKLFEKIKNNPKNVRFRDLQKLLINSGFSCRQPSGGSSHHIFYLPDNPIVSMSIPKRNPVKPIYVKKSPKINRIKQKGGKRWINYTIQLK